MIILKVVVEVTGVAHGNVRIVERGVLVPIQLVAQVLLRLVAHVLVHGFSSKKTNCTNCSASGEVNHAACGGTGHTTEWKNCTAHNAKDPHYYCPLSTGSHGTSVGEYH